MTAAGIDTDNNQLKVVAEPAGAEILVAMASTTTATVTDGDSGDDDNDKDSVHKGGGDRNGRGHRQQSTALKRAARRRWEDGLSSS